MANILVIDDDPMINQVLCTLINKLGHSATGAFDLKEGLAKAATGTYEVVFLDVNLPDGNGLEILPELREAPSRPEVVIITGAGDPDGAEMAIKNGAWDYMQKPFTSDQANLQLIRALEYRQGKRNLKGPLALKRDGLIGSSPRINASLDLVAQAAQTSVSILLNGETGTGKELFAHTIHKNSPRALKNFVVVDCTVLPGNLVESMLFGHEKGAFTGANLPREGLVQQADGGTLFLDEVGELPLALQKSFLRVLQERRFRTVGGKKEISVDFRLIAATNRDLDAMVRAGQFRQDLLFRLRSFTIELPPLRELKKDIRELAMYHVERICEQNGMELKGFSPEFIETLAAWHWPGNIRELVNTLERAVAAASESPILYPKHLPLQMRTQLARRSVDTQTAPTCPEAPPTDRPPGPLPTLKALRGQKIQELEHQYLIDLMAQTRGNIREACQVSGLGRTRLYELMKKHNVPKPPTETSVGSKK